MSIISEMAQGKNPLSFFCTIFILNIENEPMNEIA